MNLTAVAIRRRRVTLVAVALLILAGIATYRQLPKAEDPGFIVRTAVITTAFPGASPQRVEELVTSRIEEKVQEIPELDFVSSSSRTGRSVVFVNLSERERVVRPVWDGLRRKIADVAEDLPDGTIGPFVNDEFGDVFGVVLALVAEGYSDVEMTEISDEIRDALLPIPDVAKVEVLGSQDRRVYVEFDNARLAELRLSPGQIQGILTQQNIVTPGGVIVAGTEQIALEPSGSYGSVEELRRTAIQLPTGSIIHLGDVADVHEGTVDPGQPRVRYTGEDALGIAVSMRDGGDIGALGADVRRVVADLQRDYPIGVEIMEVNFQPDDVQSDVDDFLSNLVQSVVIVMVVMMLFLGVRTGLVVASLIPLSMVSTFFLMGIFGVGIDTISLAALLIALGMLVDNAIVMSEATIVGMSEGQSPTEAAVGAAVELRVPLLISSLTTSAAFLPIYLAESATGEYTAPLFLVVTMALLSSWTLALTAIPLFSVLFLGRPEPKSDEDGPWAARYRAFVRSVVRRPWLALGVATAALVGSLWLGRFVDKAFFPPSDRPVFTASLELAPGTTLEQTGRVVAEIEHWLSEHHRVGPDRPEGLEHWAAFVGSGAPRFTLTYAPEPAKDNYAFFLLYASSRGAVDALVPALERHVHATFPDLQAEVRPLIVGPPAGKPVAVRLSSRELGPLFDKVEAVEAHLASIPGAKNVGNDWGRRTKKLEVRVDPIRARMAGITNADIAISLQTSLSGITATEYREGDEVIPVVLRSEAADRKDIAKIESLNVFVQQTGTPVPLKQVADVALTFEDPVIKRRDLYKTVEVFAEVDGTTTAAAVSEELAAWLERDSASWGPAFRWILGGEAEASANSQGAIGEKLPIAGLAIVLLLVLQFDSLRRAAINVAVLPFGLIGVTLGLLVTGSYFGFMTLLGIISLFGIIINNANVLLDRIHLEIAELGRTPVDAILEASQRRLRPILLTTATTVGGLLPLWLGGGPIFEPMAISLIFGLLFGTVLTLGLVPAMYAIAYGVR